MHGCYYAVSIFCVLWGRGLCDELITRPEESYRIPRVVVCDLESSRTRRPWYAFGRSSIGERERERERERVSQRGERGGGGEGECSCFPLLWIIFGVSVPTVRYINSVMCSFLLYKVFTVGENYITLRLVTCIVYRKKDYLRIKRVFVKIFMK